MKAMVLSEYNKLDVVDVDAPVAGADELLIRVAACGICGSDVHGYDGSTGRRIPPIVMGHEAAGTVVGVGEEGDWVCGGGSGYVRFDGVLWSVCVLSGWGCESLR